MVLKGNEKSNYNSDFPVLWVKILVQAAQINP